VERKPDIFISFKKTDNDGKNTPDVTLAENLARILRSQGANVFFSEDSLEQIGSSRYKADIDDALDSVQAMVVVLTNAEYAASQWVKYEWDSFYNDFLSGVKKDAKLFTYTHGVDIHLLPRTLRNVQNFSVEEANEFHIVQHIVNALGITPPKQANAVESIEPFRFSVVSGSSVTAKDISEALELDYVVYDEVYHLPLKTCLSWYHCNPDIYTMVRDIQSGKIIAYINISPITEECYDKIRSGTFLDNYISEEDVLSYDLPYLYSVYIFSIVIHPQYQNTEVMRMLYDEVIKKFIYFGEHDVYIRRIIADAVSEKGRKFCKLFGMKLIDQSNHDSTIYEVTMLPPQFRVTSKSTKTLYEYYHKKYEEISYLLDN
jgi:hypothetical protein